MRIFAKSNVPTRDMRAKEYIYNNHNNLRHLDILSQAISDLMPFREDLSETARYVSLHLSSDIRYQQFTLQKRLYEQGSAMQREEPHFELSEAELPMEIALEVREELFKVIQGDESFGNLFYILGTEKNSRHTTSPIDCTPNEETIRKAVQLCRDDYPKTDLDEFLKDDINYECYNELLSKGKVCDEYDFLQFFNRAYWIYDEVRIFRNSVHQIQSFLSELTFTDDEEKYNIVSYIIKLIKSHAEYDSNLSRCENELHRIIANIPSVGSNIEVSPVHLNNRKGMKIDIIRVFNVLYELGMFTGPNGEKIQKKDFMKAMGNSINVDLSNYDNDLSRSLSDSTAYSKHLKIFDDMHKKMEDIFNLH